MSRDEVREIINLMNHKLDTVQYALNSISKENKDLKKKVEHLHQVVKTMYENNFRLVQEVKEMRGKYEANI